MHPLNLEKSARFVRENREVARLGVSPLRFAVFIPALWFVICLQAAGQAPSPPTPGEPPPSPVVLESPKEIKDTDKCKCPEDAKERKEPAKDKDNGNKKDEDKKDDDKKDEDKKKEEEKKEKW